MRTFEIQVVDGRYPVPQLKLVVAANLDGAREEAVRILNESPHHLTVNVYLSAELLFSVGRPAEERRAALIEQPSPPENPAPATRIGSALPPSPVT